MLLAWWPWGVVGLPAVVLLFEMVPLLVPIPCLDAWSFVQQYQHWIEGRYSWEAFLAPHYVHPCVVGKTIYFAVLHLLGGNVAALPILSWLFSAVIAFCVCRLARPLWFANTQNGKCKYRWQGLVTLACEVLVIFTAAQGEVWVWDFVFQNFIPGTCLAAGLLLLSGDRLPLWRLVAATGLGIIATFSFGTGFFVPALLSLPLWLRLSQKGWGTPAKLAIVGTWLAFHGAVAWFALTAPGGEETKVDWMTILDRPLMRFHFVLIVLGNILGKGTVFEPETLCAVLGGALLLVFSACLAYLWHRRQDREMLTDALPWVVFGAYGIASAALISLGRMHNSLDNALDERFATFDVFFVAGTLLLAATVLRNIAAPHRESAMPAWQSFLQQAVAPAFLLLTAALLINWEHGRKLMHVKHSRMEQERALLTFARVMPLNKEWMDARVTRKSAFRLATFLAGSGRLPGVTFTPDRKISSFKRGKKMGGKWAKLDRPVQTDDGNWRLTGTGGLSVNSVADLILITAQGGKEGGSTEEEIVALTATMLPATFFERKKQVRLYPEHYLGWSQTLPKEMLPEGQVTLRAYVLDQEAHTVQPIEGEYLIGDVGPSESKG